MLLVDDDAMALRLTLPSSAQWLSLEIRTPNPKSLQNCGEGTSRGRSADEPVPNSLEDGTLSAVECIRRAQRRESLARRRFQNPKPRKEGNFWYLRIWDVGLGGNRKRQRIRLAPASVPLREVQKIVAEKLRPVNQGLVTATSAINFTTFVQNEYIAALPLDLSRPTENSYRGCLSKYLEPGFGRFSLRELTPSVVQQYFSKLGGQIPHPTILKIRDALSSVLRYACENDFLIKNPLENLRLPKDKRPKGPKPTITVEDFNRLVARSGSRMPAPCSSQD